MHLRKATGDLDRTAGSNSVETMIKDGVIVEEEGTMTKAMNSWDKDASHAAERNP